MNLFGLLIFLQLTVSLALGNQDQSTTEPLVLKDSWKESTVGPKSIYGCEAGVHRSYLDEILFRSPVPSSLIATALDQYVEFSDEDAQRMATACREGYADPFALTGCVSRSVKEHFKGKTFDGVNSFCRSHAKAFNSAFQKLAIPRSNSSDLSVIGQMNPDCSTTAHVVNRVTFVSDEGQPYSYAIDSGWHPGDAFPLTEMTVNYHKENKKFPVLFADDCYQCTQKKSPFSPLREMLQFINND